MVKVLFASLVIPGFDKLTMNKYWKFNIGPGLTEELTRVVGQVELGNLLPIVVTNSV